MTGGKGGGGTVLTRRGTQLVENFRVIEREHRRFVAQLSAEAEGIADDFLLLRRMSMKTSARNQFFGTVTRIQTGAVNAEVEIALNTHDHLVAMITMESLAELRLALGSEVWALVKAPSVLITADDPGIKLSARNRLCGTVSRITLGSVHADVVIDLPGGAIISAIITLDSLDGLALTPGSRACAVFKAGSVILGVNA